MFIRRLRLEDIPSMRNCVVVFQKIYLLRTLGI